MINKKIEKELNKIKEKESIDIADYIENLESSLDKIKEQNLKLMNERKEIIEELEEKIRVQTILIKLSKNDKKAKEVGIRRNIIYKEILDIFDKNNKEIF